MVQRTGPLRRKLFALFALTAGASGTLGAQAGSGVTAVLTIHPFPSPFIADWERNPQTAQLTVIYTGTTARDISIVGYVRSADRGELARVASPTVALGFGPVTQLFNSADILEWRTVSRNQQYTDMVLRAGVLPEGRLEMCAEVRTPQDAVLAQTCTPFTIALPDPPQLIFPLNRGVIAGLQPVFQWTPVRAPAEIGVTYRVRAFEVFQGQTAAQAVMSNPPRLDAEVTGAPVLVYPIDALPLEDRKEYAWQVEALDAAGNRLARGGRSSEIWTFLPGGPGREGPTIAGVLPDVIDLVPGVARLKGLRTAEVEEGIANYVLNGRVRLEVLAPAAFEVDVDAQDVAIDRLSLATQPRITAGTLDGALKDASIPATVAGRFVTLDRVTYTPQAGLTMSAQLALPGGQPLPLTGTLQVTGAGLYGTLRAAPQAGRSIAAFGADPARLLITGAQVTYPAATLELAAGLELFASDVDCGGITASLTDAGALAAQVSCTPRAPVPLIPGGDRAQIALLSLAGNFAYDPSTSASTYDISGPGQLRLDAGGSNCGASLQLSVRNSGVSASEFTPRCDANEGAAALGWLSARLSSLALKRLSYAAGTGFDFELTVDMMPWMPEIPGFQLPALVAVTIGRDGLAIPAIDIGVSRPSVTLAGFGIAVKRLRLPAFTLSWADWEIGSADGFVFGFDADFTMPRIEGEASCLTAQPIPVTNAQLSRGGFRMDLAEKRFTPACGVTLQASGARNLNDVPLTEGGGGGGAGGGSGGGGGMAGTVRQMMTQLALGAGGGSTAIDRCGHEIPAAWEEPAKVGTQQKCGEGPWSTVEEKKPPPMSIEEQAKANDEAFRKAVEEEFDKQVVEKRKNVETAQQALDAALDDPKCAPRNLDAATRQACDRALAKARDDKEKAVSELVKSLDDRYFLLDRKKFEQCYQAQRSEGVSGLNAYSNVLCKDLPDRDAVTEKIRDLVVPPWLMPPARTPPASEVRNWCNTFARAAGVIVLSDDRQRQLYPTGKEYSGPSAITQMSVGLYACGDQANQDVLEFCKKGSGATPNRLYDAARTTLALQKQAELFGLETESDAMLKALAACPAAQTQALGTVTVGEARPPNAFPGGLAGETAAALGGPSPGGTPQDSTQAEAPAPMKAADGITIRAELDRVGGRLDIGFYPFFLVRSIPEIEGKIVLPDLFTCTGTENRTSPVTAKLRLGPRGEINAGLSGFVPSCPVSLAAVEVRVTESELTFSTEGGTQSLLLVGGVTAKFNAAQATAGTNVGATGAILGTGRIAIDLLQGRLIDGRVAFAGPFTLSLPREKPVLGFTLQSAALDTAGIHIDGRGQLNLSADAQIGTTFNQVTIDPRTVAIRTGTIAFDASFGFEVGINSGGQLDWAARPRGAAMAIQSGIRIDLPSDISIGANGFAISGDGGARLVYEGKDVDGLTTRFSPGFTLALNPPSVGNGVLDLQRNGVSMAYIDRAGFHPNLAYFASAALPARLPLPSEAVAYLELRDAAGNLRVTTENTGQGVRLYTAAGQSVPLIVPALQVGRPSAPRLNVTLDLTLDPLNQNVSLGGITATVPASDANAFDLSANGLPLAIQRIAYTRADGGAYAWNIVAALKLFNQTQGAAATDLVNLAIDNTGRLAGSVTITPNQAIPIVQGSQKLTLTVQRVQGSFDANLNGGGPLQFSLGIAAGIEAALSATQTYKASATFTVDQTGVHADNIAYDTGSNTDEFKYLDLSVVQLGLRNLRIPEFSYAQATGFRFRMLFDAAFRFPELQNLRLPPIQNIELTNSGFSIPAWEAPNLHLATATSTPGDATMTSDGPLELGGFALHVKAFRMGALSFNWFTGQGPSNFGFSFDLELGLGTLIADAPQSLRDMRVQILGAGFQNGRFTGTLEPITFPTPIDLGGVGKLYAISGQLPNAGGPGTPFSLRAEVGIDFEAALSVCEGTTKITKPNVVLEIFGDGWISGSVDDVLPQCVMQPSGSNPPFQFRFGSSRLVFGYGNTGGAAGPRTRVVELSAAAQVSFPGITEGTTVTAGGAVKFDLLQGRWIDGHVDINAQFSYRPSDDNPYFAFNVTQARLDATGLRFNGNGSLRAKDGASIGITFNDFTFALPSFQPTGGSVTFHSAFALGVGIVNGSLQWGIYSPTAPRPPGSSFRFVAPEAVRIDASGVSIAGTATAELRFNDTTFANLQVGFLNDFKVGFNPVRVTAGRANFTLNNELVAHVDPNGFWPGNVFGVIPVPARLGLPGEDVAYLQLRDANNVLLIDMQTSATGLQLRTKPNQSVKLVVPALASTSGGVAPAVDVSFDVVVNPANFQFISGFVRAESPANAPPLMSLAGLGIPLTIRRIAYEPIGAGVYGVRLAARFKLPESLNGLDVDVPNLVVTQQGLWGEVKLGSYLPDYVAGTSIASASFLGDTLKIDVTGAHLKFGPGAAFALKGQLTSALFKNANEPPAKLRFTAAVSEQAGFMLTMDETQGARLPLAIAFFEPKAIGAEPALRVTASANDFRVRLTGVVTVPDISPTFAVTIAGLEIGKTGVTFPTISISGMDQSQELDIFGAKFRLQDSTAGGNVVYPALRVAANEGVVALTLSGQVTFLENTSRFWGLTVATNGQFSIAGASLLSKPLVIAQDILSVDKITIENNALKTEVSVTLPEPLNTAGPQKVYFAINSQGQVSGGADLAIIRQAASFTHQEGSGPNTHFDAGIGTAHLRYLGVTLDFGPQFQQNSSVQVVADFYIQNNANNRVKVGDVTGNTVNPGLKIAFNGNVSWGVIALAQEFNFDFDVAKLKVQEIALAQRPNNVFALSISGQFSLAVSAVSGYLAFEDFTVTSQGNVEFSASGIKGGELSIADVVTVQLSDLGYSPTPTTIQIKKGDGLPKPGQDLSVAAEPSTGMQDIQVASFISFGGRISVLDVFSGGVQRFLFYKGMDNTTHLLIEQINVKVMDIITINGDFKYDEFQGGFEMLLGAEGTMFGYNIIVVGALAKEMQLMRAGIFVAVRGLTIQIGPYVQIAGLGGGFFLNPRPEWLEYVRVKAKVSQTAGAYIATPPAGFAVLLYGEMGLITSAVVKGRMLITIADTFFRIDGYGTILMQDGMLEGDLHIQVAFEELEVQGNIGFKINYGGIVNGGGYINVFVNAQGAWGITGKTKVTVIAMLQGDAEIAIGPAGFYLDAKITMGLNIWVIQLDAFMGAKIWYLAQSKTFGGYTEMGVKASVLGGVVQATGTLRGAVMLGQGNPFLFLAASLEASCPVGKWEGWVWAKMQDGQITAGFGQDPSMMAAIDAAKSVAGDMQQAKEEAEVALGTSKTIAPASVALTDQELVAAYRNIQGWSEGQFFAVKIILEIAEVSAQKRLLAAQVPIEDSYRGWYYDVLRRVGMPGDSALIVQYTRDVQSAFTSAEQVRPQVEARIAALQLDIQQLNPFTLTSEAALASPVRSVTAATYRTTIGRDGKPYTMLATAPGFEVDEAAARSQVQALDQVRQTAEANDLLVRQQISALENGLLRLRAVTTSSDPAGLPSFVGWYARIGSNAERQFASQADLMLSRQDWMRARQGDLVARDAASTQWITQKTQSLHSWAHNFHASAPCQTDEYTLAKEVTRLRVRALAALSGNPALLTQYDDNVSRLTPTTCWTYIANQMNTSGKQLYYAIANAGMTDAIAKTDPAFASLGTDASTRLGTIRGAHASLSNALDKLYQVQAEATGALYDLYDRYHFWRTGVSRAAQNATTTSDNGAGATVVLMPVLLVGSPAASAPAQPMAPSIADLTNMDLVRSRMDRLATDLTVPRVNSVQVTASNSTRYSTQLQFSWSAWHPSGTYEFRFRDAQAAGANGAFLSNGPTGSLTSYKFTPNRSTASTQTHTLDVGVRGGAGFTGFGRTSYTLNFLQAPGTPATVSGGGLVMDQTPPSTPIVAFSGLTQRIGATGQPETWTHDPLGVLATWAADDPESGVGEYEYALWATPNGSSVVRPFTTAGGRTQVALERLDLASRPLYVAVRAKNGQGAYSATGVSPLLRYDATPPAFAAGSAITLPGAGLRALASPQLSLSTSPTASCPVTMPALPGTQTGGFMMPILQAVTVSTGANRVAPRFTVSVPLASDPESGIGGYVYRVTEQLDTVYAGSGWTSVPAATQLVTVEGDPLDYQRQFFVAIAPKNTAGAVGKPLTYGPFIVPDPTAPTAPTICVGSAGPSLYANLQQGSVDDETAMTGYQYRVRTAQGAVLRNWPASGVDWSPGSFNFYTNAFTGVDGTSYLLDVRAVNAQGGTSIIATSGPMVHDGSAPPTPSASLRLGTVNGGAQQLIITVNAPTDPHTGLSAIQYAVGSTAGGSNLVRWTESAVLSQLTVNIPTPAIGATVFVQLRTVNGAGIPSVIGTSSYTVPAMVLMPVLMVIP